MNHILKNNYLYNTCYQLLNILIPLITTPYISRVLHAEGVGLYSYTYSIVSYFVLFASNGTNTYGQREIAYLQNNKDKRSLQFWNTFIFRFSCSLISFCVYVCVFINDFNNIIFLVQGIHILTVFIDITWFFQGMERFKEIVIKNTIVKIVGLLCIFLFVKKSTDIVLYIMINTVSIFVGHLLIWPHLTKWISFRLITKSKPFSNVKIILSLFIPQIAIQFYTVLDKTMIGIITKSATENGYYEQAYKIISMCTMIVTSLGTVMIPRIANIYAKHDNDLLKNYIYRSYQFTMFLSCPLCAGLFVSASQFTPWFLGNGFESVPQLIKTLAFIIPAIGLSNVTGLQFFMTTERQNKLTFSVISGALINFILNLFLIRCYHSQGAAIASIIAEWTVTIVQFYFARNIFHWQVIVKKSLNYIISSIVMYLVLQFSIPYISTTLMGTLSIVILGGFIYFSVLYLLKDELLSGLNL